MSDLICRLLVAVQQQQKSPYAREFRKEHAVIPSLCGLPRIVRAFTRS